MSRVRFGLTENKADAADLTEGVFKLKVTGAAAVQTGIAQGDGVDARVAVGVVPAISLVPVRPALRARSSGMGVSP